MLGILYPDCTAASAYTIPYEKLWRKGVRGLLFDIDNTLVPHGAPATEESVALFARLHEIGFATCLISNNKDPRVKPFADAIDTDYLCDAHKPSGKGFRKACAQMGTDEKNTVFIGDQIFTDILGANLAGLPNILVKPLDPHEEIQIVFKRKLERPILWLYHRKKRLKKGRT